MFVAIPVEIDQVRAPRVAPIANGCLVVLNVLGFALGTAGGWSLAPGSSWWTVLTHGFAHAGPGHLVGNMFVLLLVGNPVNRRLGNGYYLLAYLGTLLTLGVLGRWVGIGPISGTSALSDSSAHNAEVATC